MTTPVNKPDDEPEDTERHDLIGSDRVEGTRVYRPGGEKIGRIERVMIDKRSGRAAYAVMSFGGFLGLGEEFYPLPWSVLTYNPELGGYEVALTEEQLKNAPKYVAEENIDLGNRTSDAEIYAYYGVPPYWV
jgi:PRC-barrel domain